MSYGNYNNYATPSSTPLSYPPSQAERDSSVNSSQEPPTAEECYILDTFIEQTSTLAIPLDNTQTKQTEVDKKSPSSEKRRNSFSLRIKSQGREKKNATDKAEQLGSDSLSKDPSPTRSPAKTSLSLSQMRKSNGSSIAKKFHEFKSQKLSHDSFKDETPKSQKAVTKLEALESSADIITLLSLLEKAKPGNFQIFIHGDTLNSKIQEIESPEIKQEMELLAAKSEAYKIYLTMSGFADKLKQQRSSKELLCYIIPKKHSKDTEQQKKLSFFDLDLNSKMTDIALNIAAKNDTSSTNIKDLLIKEVYIQALFKQALEECAHISNQLKDNEKLDCSNPKISFLENINEHASQLFTCAMFVQAPISAYQLEDHKKIFFIFTNAIKKISLPMGIKKILPAPFSTSAIRCFLHFFENEVLKSQKIFYQKQQDIYIELNKFLSLLKKKNKTISKSSLSSTIDLIENQLNIYNSLKTQLIEHKIKEKLSNHGVSENFKQESFKEEMKKRLNFFSVENQIHILNKINKYPPHTLFLLQQIIHELHNTELVNNLKKEDLLKTRLDYLKQDLIFNTNDSTSLNEEESASSPHEMETSRRKSIAISPFKFGSKSPKRPEFFRESSNSSSGNTSRPSFLLSLNNDFLPCLILNPLVHYSIKENILNVFEFFIKNDQKKHPSQILFEKLLLGLNNAEIYIKHTTLQIIKAWLSNPFVNLRHSPALAGNTIKQIELILETINSSSQIFRPLIKRIKKLLISYNDTMPPRLEKMYFECMDASEIIKSIKKSSPNAEHISLFADTLRWESCRNFKTVTSSGWDITATKIKVNRQNPLKKYKNRLICWILNEFSTCSRKETSHLFTFFIEIIKHLLNENKGSSLHSDAAMIDFCSVKAIYSALKIISNHYTEASSKPIEEIDFQKLLKQNRNQLLIPGTFILKENLKNIQISEISHLTTIEKLAHVFERIAFYQKKLERLESSPSKFINLEKSFIALNSSNHHITNSDKLTIIQSFKLNHYIETLLEGELNFKESLLNIFKLFIHPLCSDTEFHADRFLKMLIQKFPDSDETQKIRICQLICKLLSTPFHFSTDSTVFETEKKLIIPHINALIKMTQDSENNLSCHIKNLIKTIDSFQYSGLKKNPLSLGSPNQLFQSIASGEIVQQGEQAYEVAVKNVARTLTQTSLLLYKTINTSDFVKDPMNTPNICNLFLHYTNLTYWIKGLIIDQSSKTESYRIYLFFLSVLEELIDKDKYSASNPADFGSGGAIAAALFSPFMRNQSEIIDNLLQQQAQKFEKIFDTRGNFKLLREECDKKPFKIFPLNLVTKDFMHIQQIIQDNPKDAIDLSENGPIKFLSNFFIPLSYLVHSPDIEIFDLESVFTALFGNDPEQYNNNLNDRAILKNEVVKDKQKTS